MAITNIGLSSVASPPCDLLQFRDLTCLNSLYQLHTIMCSVMLTGAPTPDIVSVSTFSLVRISMQNKQKTSHSKALSSSQT